MRRRGWPRPPPTCAGDAWLEGRGWDQNDWADQAYPTAALLDAVTGDRPVLLRRVDGHAAWANSAALRAARHHRRDTPDPDGGAILRDADGEPTGILVDNAVDLVRDVIPEPDPAETRRRILLAVDHCLAHGADRRPRRRRLLGARPALPRAGGSRRTRPALYGMYDDEPGHPRPRLGRRPGRHRRTAC